ncbi:MAG: permease [Pseudomonadota bacterium]
MILFAILALLIGPLLVQFSRRSDEVRDWVDGFALVAVSGLTLLIVLPNALAGGGPVTLLFLAGGLLLPKLLHRLGTRALVVTADTALVLAVAVHAAVECAALAFVDEHLSLALVAHRVPVGLAVFMLASSNVIGWRYVAVLAVASAAGFIGGQEFVGVLDHHQHAWLEGFVAGSLLHVVYGHSVGESHGHRQQHEHEPKPHAHAHAHPASSTAESCAEHDHRMSRTSVLGALGALMGLALVLAVLIDPHHHHGAEAHDAHAMGVEFGPTLVELALISAPALVLGYLLAGLVRVFLSPRALSWLHSGSRLNQASKGIAFGLPLPICSCGVLPLYQSLIRSGVPLTAGIAFLIATPEIGIDALLLSVPLLGESLTLLRLAAALAVALGVALLLGHSGDDPVAAVDSPSHPVDEPLTERLMNGLRFGFIELLDHTLPWIALGLVLAALLAPLLHASVLTSWSPVLQVPLFVALSIPAYVCASGATPIAAVAIAAGVSPGAALAFLIAGPATNVTTFGILSSLHSRAFALRFGFAVAFGAVVVGWLVDLSGWVASVPLVETDHDEHHWINDVALVLLGALTLASLFRQGPRGLVQQIITPFQNASSPA